jgi:hypothetical protein
MIGEWVKSLDNLLRGEATRLTALQRGSLELPTRGLSILIIFLSAFYGACMASFAAFNRDAGTAILQMIASAGKVPLLFFLTLFVTFPSLYVFNALIGSRLTLRAVWQLLIATLAVMVAVLASLGPVVAFFSVSTTGYNFMLIFNVLVCAAAGLLGLKFLLFTLHRLTTALDAASTPGVSTPGNEPKGALEKIEGRPFGANVTAIFRIWVIVFALVGAQMSWVLRPFIGAPHVAFAWLRERDSNFFEAVFHALGRLLGG